MTADPAGSLKKVAEIGYKYIEPAAMPTVSSMVMNRSSSGSWLTTLEWKY